MPARRVQVPSGVAVGPAPVQALRRAHGAPERARSAITQQVLHALLCCLCLLLRSRWSAHDTCMLRSGQQRRRRDATEPTAAYGPAGSTGEENLSVVVAPIAPGQPVLAAHAL